MDAIRILVVGDAHVGKTTLIDVLCGEYDDIDTEKTRRRLTSGVENSTVGCYINIREHEMSRQHRQHNSATPVLPKTHIASHHRRNNNSLVYRNQRNPSSQILGLVGCSQSMQCDKTCCSIFGRSCQRSRVRDIPRCPQGSSH